MLSVLESVHQVRVRGDRAMVVATAALCLLGAYGGGSSVGLEHSAGWRVRPHLEKWTAGRHVGPGARLVLLWQPRRPRASVGNTNTHITLPRVWRITSATTDSPCSGSHQYHTRTLISLLHYHLCNQYSLQPWLPLLVMSALSHSLFYVHLFNSFHHLAWLL